MEPVKLAMISQPMKGLSDDEIKATREKATEVLEKLGYKVINTYFAEEWADPNRMLEDGVKHIPVQFLSKAIDKLSKVDAVYFCKGWEQARGCCIEHTVCTEYHIQMYEE